jgi:hypothetical protein
MHTHECNSIFVAFYWQNAFNFNLKFTYYTFWYRTETIYGLFRFKEQFSNFDEIESLD